MSERALPLPSGVAVPLVGFGTWRLSGAEARQAVEWALEAGYRHVDTASMYRNEHEVGAALRAGAVPRDEVFVTTKLLAEDAGDPAGALGRSLDALGLDAVDLYLVHWPPGGAGVDTWRALLELRDRGLARAVGVSNYDLALIDELVDATGEAPAVNQVKWGPSVCDLAVLQAHRERGIVLEGYSPLRSGGLDSAAVAAAAEAHGRTPAQVVIRWHVDTGVVVIPKSAQRDRIVANFDVWDFALTPDEVAAISTASGDVRIDRPGPA